MDENLKKIHSSLVIFTCIWFITRLYLVRKDDAKLSDIDRTLLFTRGLAVCEWLLILQQYSTGSLQLDEADPVIEPQFHI